MNAKEEAEARIRLKNDLGISTTAPLGGFDTYEDALRFLAPIANGMRKAAKRDQDEWEGR